MRPLFFPAVFTQKILIIFWCGWGLHSFDSIQVEFLRMFPGRKPHCVSLIFSASSTQLTGVAVCGALSRAAAMLGSPVLGWLCFLSDLISPQWTSLLRGTCLAAASCNCVVSWYFSALLNQNFLRRWRPVVFSSHTHTRIWKQTNFPNWLVSWLALWAIIQIN